MWTESEIKAIKPNEDRIGYPSVLYLNTQPPRITQLMDYEKKHRKVGILKVGFVLLRPRGFEYLVFFLPNPI